MKQLFLIQYRDGGRKAEYLKADKYGAPTKKEFESLGYRGFSGWINLEAYFNNEKKGTKVLEEISIDADMYLPF